MTIHLVDTSAWIEWLRDTGSPACRAVQSLRDDAGSIAVTQPVELELRAGASRAGLPRLERLLSGAVLLDVDPQLDFGAAADLYLATRDAGRPVRAVMSCLIAAVAIRTESVLVHADRDFDVIASVARDLHAVRAPGSRVSRTAPPR